MKQIKYETKTREFKSYMKKTKTAILKIGEKKYKVKQEEYVYFDNETKDYPLRPEWYLTKTQMRNLLKAYPEKWLLKVKSRFDGMVDCVMPVEDEFSFVDPEILESISDDIRCYSYRTHYNTETGVFNLWSCVGAYEFKFDGELQFL